MLKTPISVLQEYVVQKKLPIPDYEIQSSGLPPAQVFTCDVTVDNKTACGTGPNKKDAKQDAARNLLKQYGIQMNNDEQVQNICLLPKKITIKNKPTVNYVGKLNEFSSQHRQYQPIYTDGIMAQNTQFCIMCSFNDHETYGYGDTKKDAKQDAARQMLTMISEYKLNPVENVKETFTEQNNNIEEVLKKYNILMENLSISEPTYDTVDGEAQKENKVSVSTWDELMILFAQRKYTHQLLTFQEEPLILCLKINSNVFMAEGHTISVAKENLLGTVVDMLNNDFLFD